MPIYIFKCPDCGLEFETIAKMNEKEKECQQPLCKGKAIKQFTASNQKLHFKCDGFHTTDYEGKKVR